MNRCRQVASFCQTPAAAGKCYAGHLEVGKTIQRCRELQQETHEALGLPGLPLTGFVDIDSALTPVRSLVKSPKGSPLVLHPLQLSSVAKALKQALRLRETVLEQSLNPLGKHEPASSITHLVSSETTQASHELGGHSADCTKIQPPSRKAAGCNTVMQNQGAVMSNGTEAPVYAIELAKHASRISPSLQEVVDAIQHAIDLQSGAVRDESSPELRHLRQRRRENAAELASVMDHWCKELFRQKASTISLPVTRRNRQCCSVKRGSSGVRSA
jgi:hypothetical protein